MQLLLPELHLNPSLVDLAGSWQEYKSGEENVPRTLLEAFLFNAKDSRKVSAH